MAAYPTQIKLFEGEWRLSSFDLSSLSRLLAQLEELFIRLALTVQLDVSPQVRQRWDLLVRQRKLQREAWLKGESASRSASGGYLTVDPTPNSYSTSPGRYRDQFLSFYSQTSESHESYAKGHGFRDELLHNPLDPSAARLPPLLERMLRTGLLSFDPSLDMLQRLQAMQSLMQFVQGYNLAHLYAHLWIGVRIHITLLSYEGEVDDRYRYDANEWHLPYNFERQKLVQLIHQWLHTYHSDNPQGLTLLDKVVANK